MPPEELNRHAWAQALDLMLPACGEESALIGEREMFKLFTVLRDDLRSDLLALGLLEPAAAAHIRETLRRSVFTSWRAEDRSGDAAGVIPRGIAPEPSTYVVGLRPYNLEQILIILSGAAENWRIVGVSFND